jgi:cation transport ATPase
LQRNAGDPGCRTILLNPWLQLALIFPVMLYTGWPIYRIGWEIEVAHPRALDRIAGYLLSATS